MNYAKGGGVSILVHRWHCLVYSGKRKILLRYPRSLWGLTQ